jgi:hypothetical protein
MVVTVQVWPCCAHCSNQVEEDWTGRNHHAAACSMADSVARFNTSDEIKISAVNMGRVFLGQRARLENSSLKHGPTLNNMDRASTTQRRT